MPAVEWHVAAIESGLLRVVLELRAVRVGRLALPGQPSRRIDIGEIGADRLAVAVDQTGRQCDPAYDRDDVSHEQDQAVATGARDRKPLAGSDTLPDMSHFAAE